MSGVADGRAETTREQREIRDVVHEFAAREVRPIARAVDEADTEMPWEIWHKAADLGLTTMMLPEAYGGAGMTDLATQCVVQEEICWGDPGIGNLLTSNGFFAEPLLELGSEEQKRRWIGALCEP
ncbi:MAG: acyl-CoA dehydrogenase family protein, partial [Actinomycetota bacterium]|nr:acyl-CoA dehydrogenase family protein [Actinomycetota bacterium]